MRNGDRNYYESAGTVILVVNMIIWFWATVNYNLPIFFITLFNIIAVEMAYFIEASHRPDEWEEGDDSFD